MPEQTIVLNVTYTLRPGKRQAFLRALEDDGVIGRVRREAGCLQYEFFAAVEEENRLMLVEGWDTQANLDAHCAGENFKTMQAIEGAYVTHVDVKRF